MTSCYGKIGKSKSLKEGEEISSSYDPVSYNYDERRLRKETIIQVSLTNFPVEASLKDGRLIELDIMKPEEYDFAMTLLNSEIENGNSWPFTDQLSKEEFLSYFISNDAFTVRLKEGAGHSSTFVNDKNNKVDEVVCGIFYIKPNFPGRCKHICNGGFITNPTYRNLGVGTLMATEFKKLGKALGYRGSLFNLVFGTNPISQSLWKKCGFQELAVIPNCAYTKTENGDQVLTNAHQFYCEFD